MNSLYSKINRFVRGIFNFDSVAFALALGMFISNNYYTLRPCFSNTYESEV